MSEKVEFNRVVGGADTAEAYTCPVCLNILWYGHIVSPPCEHWLCEDCYDTWKEQGSNVKCPVCNDDKWGRNKQILVQPSRILGNLLTIKCLYANHGCLAIYKYSDAEAHEKTCVYGELSKLKTQNQCLLQDIEKVRKECLDYKEGMEQLRKECIEHEQAYCVLTKEHDKLKGVAVERETLRKDNCELHEQLKQLKQEFDKNLEASNKEIEVQKTLARIAWLKFHEVFLSMSKSNIVVDSPLTKSTVADEVSVLSIDNETV